MDSFSRFLTSAAAVGGSSMGTAALTYVLVPDFQETAGEFVEDPVDSSIDVVEYLLEETTDLGGELIGLAYSNEAVYQLMDPDKVAEASSYAADIVSSLS